MITAKYILENEAGERFDLTAPANIFLVNVEGLGITTNVTYGDLENGFFHTLYEQTPQNNITGDLVYQTAAYDNYQTLVNWIIRAKALYFCYQPLETEYRRIVKLNYIVKERRTAGGWMRAGISFAPLTPWYLAQPTEIGMGGIEEELSKGYFQDGEASLTIEPVQDLHGYGYPWPGGGGENKFFVNESAASSNCIDSASEATGVVSVADVSTAKWSTPYIGYSDVIAGKTYTISGGPLKYGRIGGSTRANGQPTGSSIPDVDIGATIQSAITNVTASRTFKANASQRIYWFYCTDAGIANHQAFDVRPVVVEGSNAGTWSPYSNICPITPGLTLVRDDESTLEVYGGTLDAATGVLIDDRGVIASYAGQTLPGEWISSMDVYEAGTTPTTGAQVVYERASPVTYQLTAAEVNRALDILGVSYGYRYTADLRYGGDAAGTMSATIAPSGHVPAAVVLRYTGAITNPRVRLVGAETGIVYGICEINTSLTSGQTFELSTRYEDSHVMLIDGGGTETSLLGYVNQAYETYFRCPTTESAVLTIESDNAFSGEATLLVYTYFGSV